MSSFFRSTFCWLLSICKSWDSKNWEAYMYNVHGLYGDQNISVGKIDVCVEVCVVLCTIIRSTVFESYHRMKIILALREATI